MPPWLLKLSWNFFRRSNQLTSGRPEWGRALGREVRGLHEDPFLPGPNDYETLLPPVGMPCSVRRVTGCNLWILYRAKGEELVLVTLVATPPPPRL